MKKISEAEEQRRAAQSNEHKWRYPRGWAREQRRLLKFIQHGVGLLGRSCSSRDANLTSRLAYSYRRVEVIDERFAGLPF